MIHFRNVLRCAARCATCLFVISCGSSPTTGGDAALDTLSESVGDHPTDGPRADGSEAGSACGSLPNTASAVVPTPLAAVRMDYAGGSVADGIYELVAVEQTEAIEAGEQYRRTFKVQAGATAFEWVIDDVNVPGGGTGLHLSGGLQVAGSTLTFSGSCASGRPYYFTATAQNLDLYYLPSEAPTVEKIYHHRLRP
jgi:hypothetical protein